MQNEDDIVAKAMIEFNLHKDIYGNKEMMKNTYINKLIKEQNNNPNQMLKLKLNDVIDKYKLKQKQFDKLK